MVRALIVVVQLFCVNLCFLHCKNDPFVNPIIVENFDLPCGVYWVIYYVGVCGRPFYVFWQPKSWSFWGLLVVQRVIDDLLWWLNALLKGLVVLELLAVWFCDQYTCFWLGRSGHIWGYRLCNLGFLLGVCEVMLIFLIQWIFILHQLSTCWALFEEFDWLHRVEWI